MDLERGGMKRSRGRMKFFLALVMTAVAFVVFTGDAFATATYQSGGFMCESGGVLVAYTPNVTSSTGGMENAYWQPALTKWDSQRGVWSIVRYGSDYIAAVNSGGPVRNPYNGYYWQNGNAPGSPFRFTGLTAGYYRLWDQYRWQSGVTTAAWGYRRDNTSTYYCHFV